MRKWTAFQIVFLFTANRPASSSWLTDSDSRLISATAAGVSLAFGLRGGRAASSSSVMDQIWPLTTRHMFEGLTRNSFATSH